MSRYHSHINHALRILESYNPVQPFPAFLNNYFRGFRQAGSRDRKQIAQLCYAVLRMGRACAHWSLSQKMGLGLWLTGHASPEYLDLLWPEWTTLTRQELTLSARAEAAENAIEEFLVTDIFPCAEFLTPQIPLHEWALSHLRQPDLFIRIRPGYEDPVRHKLEAAGIAYAPCGSHCLRLPPGSKLENLFLIDREVLVQDKSSQQVGQLLQGLWDNEGAGRLRLWDCCAASGGKSLMAIDQFPQAKITVSDIRKSILENLDQRFQRAGIRSYQRRLHNLETGPVKAFHAQFDLVIADVPCSGSGTWARNPEWLGQFSCERIKEYQQRQQKIVTHAVDGLRTGGYLLYITCSVFKEENEELSAFITEKLGLTLQRSAWMTGYADSADTLYAALFSA